MSTTQPTPTDAAIQEWKDKLAALQEAEALIPMTDVEARRLNAKQQAEAKRKIAELETPAPSRPASPPRSLRDKTQIGAGGMLALTSLLAAVAQITGHLKEIVENLPFLKSLPPIYIGAALAILLLTGLLLLWRGLFAGLRPPDAKRLVVDPEKNPDQFVGRKADLQSLTQCLDEGHLVFLSGESGCRQERAHQGGLAGLPGRTIAATCVCCPLSWTATVPRRIGTPTCPRGSLRGSLTASPPSNVPVSASPNGSAPQNS